MKPTPEQLRMALAEAEHLREAGDDSRFLAKTVLYQHERLRHLEAVLAHAERLVRFGLDEHEHALLIKALDAAKRAEETAGQGGGDLGLA